ncbi:LPS-assembly lipoprotein [Luteibacter sp. Sphag1AF]|uniref:LPS-assembly lipoprotein LptE n=1 Tax=Luteibacter sp. Sphag1AF TaxID=2587031 RepID=UPI00160EB726|nr:LPS assembly lipoprotein LptE [Luteibacter sp. Sphag1AF]MBB3225547.1 LPS-assembly lipoprotein [Luteibacter sp. Sphag1AF]
MSLTFARSIRSLMTLATVALLAGCGFHLRQSAALPVGMEKIHLTVSGGGALDRDLRRALENSNATLVDKPGVDVAELVVTTAAFRTDTLTVSGTARVTEYAVHYHVEFNARAGDGTPLVAQQSVDMSREFSYDATNTIGSATQTEELQRSLVGDMVQSILFRLQAAGAHPVKAVAPTPAPEPAPVPAPTH